MHCMYVYGVQELDKKFQQTAAYRNMKEILTKKNEQIKEIRKRLQRWATFNKDQTLVWLFTSENELWRRYVLVFVSVRPTFVSAISQEFL